MTEAELRTEYAWAIEIVRKHFVGGLKGISDEKFLRRRYEEFRRNDDPVYADLLAGMGDERLSKTFVSYWILGQTMATQSRFWLENAVAELIIHQAQKLGRDVNHVYTQNMLADGWLLRKVEVADIGEDQLEHLTDRRPWRAMIQRSALEGIDLSVGQRERERVAKRELFATGLRSSPSKEHRHGRRDKHRGMSFRWSSSLVIVIQATDEVQQQFLADVLQVGPPQPGSSDDLPCFHPD